MLARRRLHRRILLHRFPEGEKLLTCAFLAFPVHALQPALHLVVLAPRTIFSPKKGQKER